MIEVENLTKTYGPKVALQGVSFTAERGEILGLLGPNGAGKSTTMRILTGYFPPTSGSARIAGYDVVEDSLEVRRRIGYLPENVPLYTDMTVRAYMDFVARAKQVQQRQDNVDWAMDAARVDHMADTIIGRLSKGYRQRVGLAQSLLGDPEVLILDEPTAGLDPNQIIETRQLIKTLGGDRTIILSTHILPEVSMVCSKVVIINRGTVVAVDTPHALTRQLTGADRVSLLVRAPAAEAERRLRGIAGVVEAVAHPQTGGLVQLDVDAEPGADVREQLSAAIVGQGWGLLELRAQSLSLEDIFLQLTTSEDHLDSYAQPAPAVAEEVLA
ncbi:MAG: Gliding motility-associated ABC transporter ATP-binding protein GldA [uncultured Chloroflexi bacterium]|uniref:Gliding motility-associated ABC transporter ATP-binding protein GldA n=1 Tax=uncultured Chloroflexota bacterium TaxID=166587 RepID=A0A6J4KKY6_9CHLR|nr:MAG: Gliding motility-associated ABC transporter ATP-binding protein GldA [uncultured Chloroflexota bacterium]